MTRPGGKPSEDGSALSDDFSDSQPGLQWQFFKDYDPARINLTDGSLVMKAQGNSFAESSPILVNAADHSYEVIVEFDIDPGVIGGLTMFYDQNANARIAVDNNRFTVYNQQARKISVNNELGSHGFLRILNDEHEVSFYYSADGKDWNRVERTLEMSGFHHNVFGQFLSLRAGLYAFGEGNVRFDNFTYRPLSGTLTNDSNLAN